MNRRVIWKPFLLLLLLVAIAGTAVQAVRIQRIQHHQHERVHQQLELRVTRLAERIRKRSAELEASVDAVISKLEADGSIPAEDHQSLLEAELSRNPDLFGMLVAYDRGHAPGGLDLFAPYGIRERNGTRRFQQIEDDYDYTRPGHEWFSIPLTMGRHVTDLYYGRAGRDWMITFAKAFHQPGPDGAPRVAGIVGAEYSLTRLWSFFQPGAVPGDGYSFLFSETGRFLAHPDSRLIAEDVEFFETLEGVSRQEQQRIRKAVRNREPIIYHIHDAEKGGSAVAKLRPVPDTPWFVVQVIFVDTSGLNRNFLLQAGISLTLGIVVTTWLAMFCALKGHPPGSRRWSLILRTGAWVILGCMVTVWILNSRLGQYRAIEQPIVGVDADLASMVERDLNRTRREHRPDPVVSPAGLLVRSVQKASADAFDVSGIAWQRLPADRPQGLEPGIYFPDADTVEFDRQFQVREDGYDVTTWKFTARLRQKFDNRLYPFDRLNLRIRMRQRGLEHPVLIVPDLPATRLGVPSALPYVANNTALSGWVLERTFYTMSSHEYDTDFGLRTNATVDDLARSCSLWIVVRREWLSSLMGVLLPVFVIMAVSFAALRMISSRKEIVAVYDFKPQRLVMLAASFSLFLVIASTGLRRELSSSGIFYAEGLFFLLYLLLGLNCWFGASIAAGRHWFSRHDGAGVKKVYWPMVLTLVYAITYLMFQL